MDDRESAFPQQLIETDRGKFAASEWISGGMSLRDYFAAKAMQGIISASFEIGFNPVIWAANAYKMADVMLKEREKSGS